MLVCRFLIEFNLQENNFCSEILRFSISKRPKNSRKHKAIGQSAIDSDIVHKFFKISLVI